MQLEREAADAVIGQINNDFLHPKGVHLEAHRWERDAFPALHQNGPQGLIDELLEIEDCDLVIGILWSRFGTPTISGETGTEHELRRAWQAWRQQGRPQVLLYTCTRPVNPVTSENARQLTNVLEFLEEVSDQQEQLTHKYGELSEFTADLRSHIYALLEILRRSQLAQTDRSTTFVPSAHYLDEPAGAVQADTGTVEGYRRWLRPAVEHDWPSTLPSRDFLDAIGVLTVDGRLTRTGALLFARHPSRALPTALVQCAHYDGTAVTSPLRIVDFGGPVTQQIESTHKFLLDAMESFESPSSRSGRSEPRPTFPMSCLREIVANAIVHRDYEDSTRMVHVRLFTDRVEIASPGLPLNNTIDAESPLERLSSQSVKRNFTLARLLTHIRLVEGEGKGILTAIEDARNAGAPEPQVRADSGYTTVTVFRCRDDEIEFADRRVATPLAKVSLNMIVQRRPVTSAEAVSGVQTFGLSSHHPVLFFVPTLPRDLSLEWRLAVTAEDVLATRSVIQTILERWPEAEFRTLIVEPDTEWSGESANVCAICREHRNSVTTALLSRLRESTGTKLGFKAVRRDKSGSPTEWAISDAVGNSLESPSYNQEGALRQRLELDFDIVEFEDVAMVARFPNPWAGQRDSKALVVAGVRAFGTWGAAEWFRTGYDELDDHVTGSDFACLLRVRKKYRVGISERGQLLLFPTDDGLPTVDVVDVFSLPVSIR